MTEPATSPNAFERELPDTAARTDAEASIEELRQRGGIFVEAVRATRMAMALTDPNLPGNPIVFANQSFLDLSGYEIEDVLGQQPHFMNGPDTDPADADRFRRILDEDRDGAVETVQYAKDGRRFVATVVLSAFKDDTGRTLNHFLSWTDVTRRVDAEGDVADIRRAQAALQDSEARFRAFVTAGAVSIYRMSPDWRLMYQLDSQILANTSEPIENWADKYILAEDRPWVTSAIDRAIRTKTMFELEHRVRLADGSIGWMMSRAVPLLGRDGEILEWFGAGSDVTARKRTEEALRASEERLQRVIDTAAVGVLFFDDEGYLVDANAAFLTMTGYSRDQVASGTLHWRDMTPPEWLALSEAQMKLFEDTGRVGPYEKEYFCADGSRRWMLFAGRDLGGGLIAEFAVDITDRRLAEDALRESEQRFREFGENSSDVLWITDVETLQLEYLSPAYERIWGESRDAVLADAAHWADLLHPDDRALAGEAMPRAVSGQPYVADYRIVRADGDVRWIRDTGFPIKVDGIVRRVGGIAQDVTDLKRADESQKLLLAELQHRVRNIMAMLRSIARRTAEGAIDVEDYRQHLEGRITAMARTQSLLTRHVGAGVNLQDYIRDELDAHAADPSCFTIDGPEVTLPAKPAEVLALAIHELATNAVKYGALSAANGRLDIRWTLLDGDDAPRLSFIWSESGVKMDEQPQRQGFGHELITERVPYELHGTGTMEFASDGVVATIEFPLVHAGSIEQVDGHMPGSHA